MSPDQVLIGRARIAADERATYVSALQSSDAGRIELDRTENATRVKRVLAEASRETNKKIRSSWLDKTKRVLLWKMVGT